VYVVSRREPPPWTVAVAFGVFRIFDRFHPRMNLASGADVVNPIPIRPRVLRFAIAASLALASIALAQQPPTKTPDGPQKAPPVTPDRGTRPTRPATAPTKGTTVNQQNPLDAEGAAKRAARGTGSVSSELWGEIDGRKVMLHTLKNSKGTTIKATDYGTIITEILVAARKSGEQPPVEVSTKIREIRRAMPRLSTLQEQVWQVLSSPEQVRLVEEITALKKTGLPKDVTEGRRPAGSPAVVTHQAAADESSETPEKPAPALWSFVDDPNAGEPLPEPTLETEARDSSLTPKQSAAVRARISASTGCSSCSAASELAALAVMRSFTSPEPA
jgi:hypothetical protein